MSNVTRLAKTCPKCHSHLMIRESENGDFLACPRFPACRYTEPMPEGAWSKGDHGTLTLELRPENNYCKECKHTGLLPFIKDGRTIAHTYIDCECKLSIPEHYDPIRPLPSDFDFPISDTFRALFYQYCGMPDPAEVPVTTKELSVETVPQKIIVKHHYISSKTLKKKDSYVIK